jgi:hypothetical protein
MTDHDEPDDRRVADVLAELIDLAGGPRAAVSILAGAAAAILAGAGADWLEVNSPDREAEAARLREIERWARR